MLKRKNVCKNKSITQYFQENKMFNLVYFPINYKSRYIVIKLVFSFILLPAELYAITLTQ
jgi:hypothetical protein